MREKIKEVLENEKVKRVMTALGFVAVAGIAFRLGAASGKTTNNGKCMEYDYATITGGDGVTRQVRKSASKIRITEIWSENLVDLLAGSIQETKGRNKRYRPGKKYKTITEKA